MKFIITFIIIILSSCSYEATTQTVDRIAAACKRVVPIARVASLVPTPPAAEIASYVIMACETNEGLAKLLADPNSEVWLNNLHGELSRLLHHNQE
jgi:hypothetical protein